MSGAVEKNINDANVYPPGHGETYGTADDVGQVIEIANKVLEVGALIIPEIAPFLPFISQVGDAVKKIIEKSENAPDPVMKKLNELEKKIDNLGNQLTDHFNEMNSFITKTTFSSSIIIPTKSLMKYLHDCLATRDKEALKNFTAAYNNRKPINIAYDMIGFLEDDETNPLKMEMKADPLRTSTTFDKWDKKINAVMSQFLLLEFFACGLIKDQNIFDSKMIVERSMKLIETIRMWKEEYKKDPSYWSNMQRVLQTDIDKNGDVDFMLKAWEIKRKLDTIITDDAFFIICRQVGFMDGQFAMSNTAKDIMLLKKDKYTMAIYRHSKPFDKEKFAKFQKDADNYISKNKVKTVFPSTIAAYARQYVDNIENAGFVMCCLDEPKNICKLYANGDDDFVHHLHSETQWIGAPVFRTLPVYIMVGML
ncbi:hypothetical protein GCK72_021710 [Caenorhabditis remanei]|uniref:Uncharacterized protein n=1 Tax=Caenorhabditis remanei TaxID=31234 RepID=A0A6A5GKM1_CAERE|nr:hypothetical protein GCK72_021710 [Caenorhabditis remanei]KAF1755141.1 hypothetical protein GCK72_021710 [Caenorhabditis remanei]